MSRYFLVFFLLAVSCELPPVKQLNIDRDDFSLVIKKASECGYSPAIENDIYNRSCEEISDFVKELLLWEDLYEKDKPTRWRYGNASDVDERYTNFEESGMRPPYKYDIIIRAGKKTSLDLEMINHLKELIQFHYQLKIHYEDNFMPVYKMVLVDEDKLLSAFSRSAIKNQNGITQEHKTIDELAKGISKRYKVLVLEAKPLLWDSKIFFPFPDDFQMLKDQLKDCGIELQSTLVNIPFKKIEYL